MKANLARRVLFLYGRLWSHPRLVFEAIEARRPIADILVGVIACGVFYAGVRWIEYALIAGGNPGAFPALEAGKAYGIFLIWAAGTGIVVWGLDGMAREGRFLSVIPVLLGFLLSGSAVAVFSVLVVGLLNVLDLGPSPLFFLRALGGGFSFAVMLLAFCGTARGIFKVSAFRAAELILFSVILSTLCVGGLIHFGGRVSWRFLPGVPLPVTGLE